jgi:TATA-box binding protein (TBP) (component of TFIID and TFIIIB)
MNGHEKGRERTRDDHYVIERCKKGYKDLLGPIRVPMSSAVCQQPEQSPVPVASLQSPAPAASSQSLQYLKNVQERYPNISPGPYKISTITAVGDVRTDVDLEILFAEVDLLPPRSRTGGPGGPGVTGGPGSPGRGWGYASVQCALPSITKDVAREFVCRSALDDAGKPMSVQRSSRRKRRPTQHFDNQCTLIYWEEERLAAGVTRGVNVKCFRNGRVQMTGVRSVEEVARIVDRLAGTLEAIGARGHKVTPGTPHAMDYRVCLINSDFCLGYALRREVLHDLFVRSYGLVSSFEPCIYPGVKLSFMWNHAKSAKAEPQNGRCECGTPKPCCGKGTGYGKCRRVTCAIFRSGNIIITGAHCHQQVEDAYCFVCMIASKHRAELIRSV